MKIKVLHPITHGDQSGKITQYNRGIVEVDAARAAELLALRDRTVRADAYMSGPPLERPLAIVVTD